MVDVTNARLLLLMQVYQNTLALVTDGRPQKIVCRALTSDEVDDYSLDIDAAGAQVDALDWHIFAPFLLGIPPMYHTVPDDYWSGLMASVGMVEGDPLDRFLTWCGETWAWTD